MLSLWLLLAALAAWLARRLPLYRLSRRLPGRSLALPLLGHTYLFKGVSTQGLFTRLGDMVTSEAGAPYIQLWVGTQLVVLVTSPECVERIIYNPTLLHKGHLLHAADKLVGNGLLFGSGPEVKKNRRGIIPAFKVKMLESYLPVFHRHVDLLVKVMKEKVVEGVDFHIEKVLHCCSFDAVNETSIGSQTDCLLGRNATLLQAMIDVYAILYEEIFKPWLYYGRIVARVFGYKFQSDHVCDMLDEHVYKSLNKIKKKIEEESSMEPSSVENMTNKMADESGAPEVTSTIEFLLRSDFAISDQDLVTEIKNIYLASSDTVAQISCFLFKMYATHPEIQERAYQESLAVLADGARAPSLAELQRLQYTECCIKETLRLFPIAPLVPRLCEQPLRLDDKVTLPAGTTILVGAFWTHRLADHWRHPDKFYPEHFLEERHRGAYLPFSGGPHSCIGQQYAMLFMKMLSAYVLRRYRLAPAAADRPGARYVADLPLWADISVRLLGGVDVKLYARQ